MFFSAGVGDAILLVPLVNELKKQGYNVTGLFTSPFHCESLFEHTRLFDSIVIKKNTALQVWWNSSYTHEYFLFWEVDGARELKNRIPTQFLQYAGISYAFTNKGLSFAFEVNNITNATTYDNFKVQLPGRWCSFKIRLYQFTKK